MNFVNKTFWRKISSLSLPPVCGIYRALATAQRRIPNPWKLPHKPEAYESLFGIFEFLALTEIRARPQYISLTERILSRRKLWWLADREKSLATALPLVRKKRQKWSKKNLQKKRTARDIHEGGWGENEKEKNGKKYKRCEKAGRDSPIRITGEKIVSGKEREYDISTFPSFRLLWEGWKKLVLGLDEFYAHPLTQHHAFPRAWAYVWMCGCFFLSDVSARSHASPSCREIASRCYLFLF